LRAFCTWKNQPNSVYKVYHKIARKRNFAALEKENIRPQFKDSSFLFSGIKKAGAMA